MTITNEMRGVYSVEVFDTVENKQHGYRAVVVSKQNFDYGTMLECERTDGTGTAILKLSEVLLVEKFISSHGAANLFTISEDTAERTRSWREGEIAKLGR